MTTRRDNSASKRAAASPAPDLQAVLDGFAQIVAQRVADELATRRDDAAGLQPLRVVADRLAWSERQLKEFCKTHDVPIYGTRKRPLVEAQEVDRAIKGTTRNRNAGDPRARAIEAGIAEIGAPRR